MSHSTVQALQRRLADAQIPLSACVEIELITEVE